MDNSVRWFFCPVCSHQTRASIKRQLARIACSQCGYQFPSVRKGYTRRKPSAAHYTAPVRVQGLAAHQAHTARDES